MNPQPTPVLEPESASPTPADAATPPLVAASPSAEVMKIGEQQFIVCAACHGPDARGTAIAPPLAGSDWVMGPVENLIRIQLRGLTGEIEVNGRNQMFPAPMAPLSHQTDEQIAGVLTYVRNSFGNSASEVTPDQVAALRSEVGKPMLTVADLTPPEKAESDTTTTAPLDTRYDSLKPGDSGLSLGIGLILVIVASWIGMMIVRNRRRTGASS